MSHWHELTAKVDAFFSRVEGRFGAEMQCRTGCSDCCHTRLTVTGVEAAAIRHELANPAALTGSSALVSDSTHAIMLANLAPGSTDSARDIHASIAGGRLAFMRDGGTNVALRSTECIRPRFARGNGSIPVRHW